MEEIMRRSTLFQSEQAMEALKSERPSSKRRAKTSVNGSNSAASIPAVAAKNLGSFSIDIK